MSEANRCPECGASLPFGALAGMCPKCLLAAGFESGAGREQPGSGGSDAPTTPHGAGFVPPEPGWLAAHFPQLEILELLGCGGMGAVYKARQTRLDRLVALKIIRPASNDDPSFAERFNREARMLARLSHPCIVGVYDFGSVDISLREMNPHAEREAYTGPQAEREGDTELYYFLMEYVDGANLRELMRDGEFTPNQALAIVPQICEALQFAHDDGVVHRDIKPENILLDKKGRVKIADFGLAKLAARSPEEFTLTGTHQVMGTPRYMAPEQMEGSHGVDHRADIFSLGVVFYEMLTGEVPVGHFEPPSKKVEIDVRLDEVVLRTLAREPERRYQRASAIKSDVDAITTTTHANPQTSPAQLARPYWKPSWKLYAAYSVIFAGMLYALFAAVYGTTFGLGGTSMLATFAALAISSLLAYWIEKQPFNTDKSWWNRHNIMTLFLGLLILMTPVMVLSPVELKEWLPVSVVALAESEEQWLRILGLGLFFWTVYFTTVHVWAPLGQLIRATGRGKSVDGAIGGDGGGPSAGMPVSEKAIALVDLGVSVERARSLFPWASFSLGLTLLASLLGLVAFAMYWTGSSWPLVGLLLPCLILGFLAGASDGDEEIKRDLPAVLAMVGVTLAAGAALVAYGVVLSSSAMPLWVVALCLVASMIAIGAGVSFAEDEKSKADDATGPDSVGNAQKEAQSSAREKIEVPAYFMILIGIIATVLVSKNALDGLPIIVSQTEGTNDAEAVARLMLMWCLAGPVVALGGYAMLNLRWYWLAMAGSVACVVIAPIVLSGGDWKTWTVLWVGGYALWQLLKPEVRAAFGRASTTATDVNFGTPVSAAEAGPGAKQPRGMLGQAWDDWWAQRDRWLTRGVQIVLAVLIALCYLAFIGLSSMSKLLPDQDGELLRHTTVELGLPVSPWFRFEVNPGGKLGWNWAILLSSWSWLVLLGLHMLWCANWQIEKAKSRVSGKNLRWWHGSPNCGLALWTISSLVAITAAFCSGMMPQYVHQPRQQTINVEADARSAFMAGDMVAAKARPAPLCLSPSQHACRGETQTSWL